MDTKRIIENGYGKLAEALPEWEQGFLAGIKEAQNQLKNFKEMITLCIYTETKSFAKIEKEISEVMLNKAIEYLEVCHDETLISFVDNNGYELDEHGNVVKCEE